MSWEKGKDPVKAIAELAALDRAVMNSLQGATDAGADVLMPAVRARAPGPASGDLLAGIGTQKYKPKDTAARATRVTLGPFYRKFLELGTSRMGAFPFIRPAYVATRRGIKTAVEDYVNDALKRALK